MFHRSLMGVLGCLVLMTPLFAQETQPTVSLASPGYGTVSVSAERLRVAIPLFAHALTADEAIALLRDRKRVARERCVALQAEAESIRFTGMTIEKNHPLQGNSYSIVQRMNAMGNPIDPEDIPVLVTARVDMTVDWALPKADGEGLVSLAEELTESLRDPDVTGKEDRPEFAPRVEEALEQLQSQVRSYSSRNTGQQDEIRYAFVAEITPQVIGEAYKVATEDAKQAITAMAAAADLEVVRMTSMSSNRQYYNQTSYSSSSSRSRPDVLRPSEQEVLASSVDDLAYTVRLHVQYAVRPRE